MSKVEDATPQAFTQVRSRWDYLKKWLLRRGVVEVNGTHPHYATLCAMKAGIKTLMTEHPEAGFKESLTPEDYKHRLKFDISLADGKIYTFESFASPVFACLRAAVDVAEEDYLQNLAPAEKSYLEFISNSRSGQHFYFSHTQRFILKTDKQHCIQHFLSILRQYIDHFLTYPHSLLVKFLGLYSIKGPSLRKKKYFLVMQSVFYPTVRLQERFDIKGCMYNRYQDLFQLMKIFSECQTARIQPNPPGKKTIIVLKDQNFLDEKIEIGPMREWFVTQLRADVDFLISLRVLDYSLLLGKHELHRTEKRESVGNLVVRMKKSFGHDKSSIPVPVDLDEVDSSVANKADSQPPAQERTNLANPGDSQPPAQERTNLANPADRPKSYDATSLNHVHPEGTPLTQASPTETSVQFKLSNAAKASKVTYSASNGHGDGQHTAGSCDPGIGGQQFLKSLSNKDYLDSTGLAFQNRRLLANCDNALHIIDGPKLRYYIGAIDFFTTFKCRQRLGKLMKDLKTCCGNHSTVPPDVYAEKFYNFIYERVV